MSNREVMLSVRDLKQHFRVDRNTTVKAVDGVSFDVYEGETFSIVGESGSGKSTLGRSLIRIYDPKGDITFMGETISGSLRKNTQKNLRKNMQMIFQDPMASLNPRKKVLDTIAFGLDIHGIATTKEARYEKVADVVKKVGLSESFLVRYPHQFSGGQRQRIGVARAIVLEPRLIICDEIISALDVSIQAQVVNLMRKLQREQGLTYIFIAHDLSMVRSISDRVAVMHLGHIVEMGTVADIYDNPVHPYTKALLSAIPHPDPIGEKKQKRVRYDKGTTDYTVAQTNMLNDTHMVLGTQSELEQWLSGDYDNTLKAIL